MYCCDCVDSTDGADDPGRSSGTSGPRSAGAFAPATSGASSWPADCNLKEVKRSIDDHGSHQGNSNASLRTASRRRLEDEGDGLFPLTSEKPEKPNGLSHLHVLRVLMGACESPGRRPEEEGRSNAIRHCGGTASVPGMYGTDGAPKGTRDRGNILGMTGISEMLPNRSGNHGGPRGSRTSAYSGRNWRSFCAAMFGCALATACGESNDWTEQRQVRSLRAQGIRDGEAPSGRRSGRGDAASTATLRQEFRRLAALGTNGPDALESMLGRLSDPRAQKQVKKLVQELSQKLI